MSAFLTLRNVGKDYPLAKRGPFQPKRSLRAVDDISLEVRKGETLGLVGESGCGKSSLARLIVQLEAPSRGSVSLEGTDLARLDKAALKRARRDFQMIFQDPYASLNPRMKARTIIAEVLHNYRVGTPAEIDARVEELARQVSLPSHLLDRFPHELSGGQCQRIGIARAIALNPRLIVADEAVSALDVSIQAQILNLIVRLQAELGLTLIFVSHDMSVIAHVSDRVAVMYLGRIVELGSTDTVFSDAIHPYSRTLLAAVPTPTPAARGRRIAPAGEMPSPLSPPSGCHFRTRCRHATALCAEAIPVLRDVGGRSVACHHAEILHMPAEPEAAHA